MSSTLMWVCCFLPLCVTINLGREKETPAESTPKEVLIRNKRFATGLALFVLGMAFLFLPIVDTIGKLHIHPFMLLIPFIAGPGLLIAGGILMERNKKGARLVSKHFEPRPLAAYCIAVAMSMGNYILGTLFSGIDTIPDYVQWIILPSVALIVFALDIYIYRSDRETGKINKEWLRRNRVNVLWGCVVSIILGFPFIMIYMPVPEPTNWILYGAVAAAALVGGILVQLKFNREKGGK